MQLTQKNLIFEKPNNDLHNRNKTLEDKNLKLQIKYDDNKKRSSKFTKTRNLRTQKASFNKEGVGYNHLNKNKFYKNFFVNPILHKKNNEACNYCSYIGHTAYSCIIRKHHSKLTQTWIAKEDHLT